MKVKLKIDRIEIDRNLIRRATKDAKRKGMWSALDYLAGVSKNEVPLDQGVLKNSCAVDVADDGSQGTVSYDTPYAVRQHEEMGYQHQGGRKAKYLEDPANSGAVAQSMRTLLRRAFEEEM